MFTVGKPSSPAFPTPLATVPEYLMGVSIALYRVPPNRPKRSPRVGLKIPLSGQKLRRENGASRSPENGVVGKSNKLPAENRVLAKAPSRDTHPFSEFAVKLGLGAVLLVKVGDEWLWRGRQAEAGKWILKVPYRLDELVF